MVASDRARMEDEIYDIEKEVFRRESISEFATIRDLIVSDTPTDRLAAVMILYRGECPNGAIPDLLVERLRSESYVEVLKHLILWFRYRHKDARAIKPICRLSNHADYMVRTCVADALGAYIDSDEAVQALARLTQDQHPNVRHAAIEELKGRS